MALFNASIVLLVNVWRGRRLRGTGRDVRKELVDVYRCIDLLSLHENRLVHRSLPYSNSNDACLLDGSKQAVSSVYLIYDRRTGRLI